MGSILRIFQRGDVYLVNEKDEIHGGPNKVTPDQSWRLVGAAEMRMVHGSWRQVRRFSVADIRAGRVPWRWKNGSQRCFILDYDHGTRRMWGNPTPYWTLAA